jgi:hypothetical protein
VIRTEMLRGVDSAAASPGADPHRRERAGGLGARIGSLLTGLAERFVEQPRKGFGPLRALAAGRVGLKGP